MTSKTVQNINRLNDVTTYGGSLFENRLINPLYQVDIEGLSAGTTTNGKMPVEGWMLAFVNDVTTQTASRVTGDSVPYALRYAVTTGSDASLAASQYGILFTAIEGYDVSDALWGTANAKSVWISGRVKAPTTGTYCISVRNGTYARSYVFEVSCTAGTWVDFEKEIPGDTSGTWDKTTGNSINLTFVVGAGSSLQTTADAWTSGSYYCTANQANGLATNGNIYEIEDIRVSVDKPIKTEYRPYSLDLAHCQRYYERRYHVIDYYGAFVSYSSYSTTAFATTKRVAPTMSFSTSSSTGGWSNLPVSAGMVDGFTAYMSAGSPSTGSNVWAGYIIANARLI